MANNNDNWARAVELLTGYPMPDENTIFEGMTGNDGIPLHHVRLDDMRTRLVEAGDYEGMNGYRAENTDFVLPFYSLKGSPSSEVAHLASLQFTKAYITMVLKAGGDDTPTGDDTYVGMETTSKSLKDENDEFYTWDSTAFARYAYSSKDAVFQLLNSPYSTKGWSNRGVAISDEQAVDLSSFTEIAKSFDRVVRFFEARSAELEAWESHRIGEEQASWEGTGASMFRGLIHKLRRNYDGYVEQLGSTRGDGVVTIDGYDARSDPGRALATAQKELYAAAAFLHDAWQAWQPMSNPQRWLYDMLVEASLYVFENNIRQVYKQGTDYRHTAAFRETIQIGGRDYGSPADMATWKAIGEEAVNRWRADKKRFLDTVASDIIVKVFDAFNAAGNAFGGALKDRDSNSLTSMDAKQQAKIARDQAEALQQESNEAQEKATEQLNNVLGDMTQSIDDVQQENHETQERATEQLNNVLGDMTQSMQGVPPGSDVGTVPERTSVDVNDALAAMGGRPSSAGAATGVVGLDSGATVDGQPGLSPSSSSAGSPGFDSAPPTSTSVNVDDVLNAMGAPPNSGPAGIVPSGVIGGSGIGGAPSAERTRDGGGPFDSRLIAGNQNHPADGLRTGEPGQTPEIQFSGAGIDPSAILGGGGGNSFIPDLANLTSDAPVGLGTSDSSPIETNNAAPTFNGNGQSAPNLSMPDLTGITGDTGNLNTPPIETNNAAPTFDRDGRSAQEVLNEHLASLPQRASADLVGQSQDGMSSAGAQFKNGSLYGDQDYTAALGTGNASGDPSAASGSSGGNGVGGPGGMYPPRGGGMGGGGGDSSSSERVRGVAEPAIGRAGSSLRGGGLTSGYADEQEHTVVARQPSTTSSGLPMMPPPAGGAPGGGQSTESGDRPRANWLPEEEDVWGTEEGGSPASLGR